MFIARLPMPPFENALAPRDPANTETHDRSRDSQLINRLRPIAMQQARESPVGKQPPSGLAAGAVVRLVLGVDDVLYGGAAVGAWFAVAAVDGEVGAERGDFLGESIDSLGAESLGPFEQRAARGVVEAGHLVV